MRKNNKIAAMAVICIGLLAVGCANGNSAKDSSDMSGNETQTIGSQEQKEGLQSFSAETLDGDTLTQDIFADKDLTMINFWGTFCSPCIAEMPDLAAFAKAVPENIQVITICVDGEYASEDARTLMEQAGYEGVTLISGDGDFAEMLGNIMAVPTTIFVDSEGNPVGDVVDRGGFEDFSGFYLEKVNAALKECGKEEISLEK